MKLYSWNVNGIRAAAKKGFLEWMQKTDADIVCLQETKAQEEQLTFDIRNIDDFSSYFFSAQRAGYSGVATYSKIAPQKVEFGLGKEIFDQEGRVLIHEFEKFSLLNIYFPNGKRSEERLQYKMDFYHFLSKFLQEYKKKQKNIIICGDVNTAHQAIDLARPNDNDDVSGFLPKERAWIDQLLADGFIDSFRFFHPEEKDRYSWWSMRSGARQRNVGWRIDYFFVSSSLKTSLKAADIESQVLGSDHCPISLELSL
jgi:exodeoxyribonuclease-3